MISPPTPLIRWATLPAEPLVPGITAALGTGERLSAALFTLAPWAEVPEHTHDNEEFGHVLRGSIEFWWGEEERAVLNAGEAFILPAGVRHRARALEEGCELLECYAPPRVPVPPTVTGGPA